MRSSHFRKSLIPVLPVTPSPSFGSSCFLRSMSLLFLLSFPACVHMHALFIILFRDSSSSRINAKGGYAANGPSCLSPKALHPAVHQTGHSPLPGQWQGFQGWNFRREEPQPSFLSTFLSAVSAARPEQTRINTYLFIECLLKVYGRFSGRPPP